MSGVAGHIRALHEDHDLTFSEFKSLLVSIAQGKLANVTEKFDGISLMFSADPITGEPRAARSLGDIVSGGMTRDDLANRFEGRGELSEAFLDGFDAISTLMQQHLPAFTSARGGQIWYAMEIVCPKARITLHYDTSNVVVHNGPVLLVNDGYVTSTTNKLLHELVPTSCDINGATWTVRGPRHVVLRDTTSTSDVLVKALQRVEVLQHKHSLSDRATLRDHLYRCALDTCIKAGLYRSLASDVAQRVAKAPGAMTLTRLKKRGGELSSVITQIVKDEDRLREQYIEPIADVVTELSIEVLRGINSAFVSDPRAEVARLREQIAASIEDLTQDPVTRAAAHKHIARLKRLDNVNSTIEGIVFTSPSGKTYKVTGAFRAYHQLVSMRRFTR